MIGILQNGGVSTEIFLTWFLRRTCLNLSERKEEIYKCTEIEEGKDFQSPEMFSTRMIL